MTTTLRLVLDQIVTPTDPDLVRASRELARALVASSPEGTDVAAIVPTGEGDLEVIPGLSDVWRSPLTRGPLTTAWQLGVMRGVGGGLIHSPTLVAPLTRHDRAHDHDQTVVTLWSLDAWLAPQSLPRGHVAAQKALLKRAIRFADAIVVPTHALADELAEIAKFADRVRVIAGAAPIGFGVPTDAPARRRDLGIPDEYVVVEGAVSAELATAFAAVASHPELHVVVLDAAVRGTPALIDEASAAGLPQRRVHVVDALDPGDRAAILHAAIAFIAAGTSTTFPWRLLDALAVETPVIAAATPLHTEVLVDAGQLVAPGEPEPIAGAIGRMVADDTLRNRMAVLAGDRARAYSWRDHAEHVWQLHASL